MLFRNKKIAQAGASLIEISLAVFIILVLLSGIFLYLRPSELRASARDQRRLSDMVSLERAVLEYKSDNNAFPGVEDTLLVSYSLPTGSPAPVENPEGGWIGVDLSPYLVKLPIDPINDTNNYYSYMYSGSVYELNARLEIENEEAQNDGGNDSAVYEVGTDLTVL